MAKKKETSKEAPKKESTAKEKVSAGAGHDLEVEGIK